MKEKVILCWSGGKDSALALHEIRKSRRFEVVSLLATLTREYSRVTMHGIREALLDRQAGSLGIPSEKVFISKGSANEEYELAMEERLLKYREKGVNTVVFGDLFLEEVRKYREDKLAKIGMKAVFPLWGKDTFSVAKKFIEDDFTAVLVCIDSRKLEKRFCGIAFDKEFLAELPQGVDFCGENGEFHTFVFDGPLFKEKINYCRGEVALRNQHFYYCDLIEQ